MMKNRIVWLDWMKVIGMYFIIAGHILPVGYEYVYVFSVPLFFVISGFLCKHETDDKVFWNKLYHNLILPMFLILTVWFVYNNISYYARHRTFSIEMILLYFLNCIEGKVGYKTQIGGGLGVCWFIYTLILCKLIYQYTFKCKAIQIIVVIACFVIAVLNKESQLLTFNALANTTLAFPLFVGGVFYASYMKKENCKIQYLKELS